jgi:hypothetical protein
VEEIASDRFVKFAGVKTQEANIFTLGGVQRPIPESVGLLCGIATRSSESACEFLV